MLRRMSFSFGSGVRIAAVAAAFGAPFGFVACDLSPLVAPGDTASTGGNGTTTTTSAGGTGGTGGSTSTTTTTSSGGTGGQGGTGGATTTTTGMGGTGGTGATGGAGGTGGTGGSTMTTTTSAGGSGGSGGSTSSTTSSGGEGGGTTTTTGMGGSGGATTTSTGEGGSMLDAGADDASDAAMGDGGFPTLCGAVIATFPIDPSPHVGSCSAVTYTTNPPTSGPHYPTWAAFKVYGSPVPRGFYVHSMEHGAVVVQYNCPSGCDADVAALVAYLDSRPPDPLCVAPLENRFIVTPDPLLDVPFAASAWGASLKAQCFDLPALGAFIDAHYAKAPENFCFDGIDVTDPASGIPAGCGFPVDAGAD